MDRTPNPSRQQPGKQEPAVAVAEEGLGVRLWSHAGDGAFGDPVCAIAAARKPYGIDRRVVRNLDERVLARRVGSSEMPCGQKALRVEVDVRGRLPEPRIGQRDDPCRHIAGERI